MRWTIRTKLILTFVLAVLFSLAALIGPVLFVVFVKLEQAGAGTYGPIRAEQVAAERVAAVAALVANTATPDAAALRVAAVPPDLPNGARVQVINSEGRVLLDTNGNDGRWLSPAEAVAWVRAVKAVPQESMSLVEPILVEGREWGYYGLSFPSPDLLRDPSVERSVQQLMFGGLGLSVIVSLILFLFFSLHLERPIRRLSAVIHQIARGDLSARADLGRRNDELGRLSQDLNAMTNRLQEAREAAQAATASHRYMVAAASHDLRTPLTALLAHAEALRSGLADDPERSLTIIYEKGLHLKRLSDDLFELAALDAQAEPWPMERRDLSELLRQMVVSHLPAMEEAGLELQVEIPEQPLWVRTAPGKIDRVLDNLLSNAVKYGGSGGWLAVGAQQVGERVRVWVADRGPGVPALERPLVFNRFYRADGARSRSGGTGLGLAIAREVIIRHGGEIGVEDQPGGGARFWFDLPLSDS